MYCISLESMKVINGEGMPTYRNPFLKGDLIIKFTVQFPEDGFASDEQLKVQFPIYVS